MRIFIFLSFLLSQSLFGAASNRCIKFYELSKISKNIFPSQSHVSYSMRERMLGQKGQVLWMSGLSGSGKSTIARALELELVKRGINAFVLDGDNIRQGLNSDLGFSVESRIENNRRVAEVAKLFADSGVIVITAFISPLRSNREDARQIIGEDRFKEIYVECPLGVCEARDVKGLYQKARAGQVKEFTGISSPFEAPVNPDIRIETDKISLENALESIIDQLHLSAK